MTEHFNQGYALINSTARILVPVPKSVAYVDKSNMTTTSLHYFDNYIFKILFWQTDGFFLGSDKTSYVSNSGDTKEQTIVSLGGKNIICNFRGQMQNLICSKKKLQETQKNNQLAI